MIVRAPQPGDAEAVLGLIVARDIADVGQPDYTLEDVRADWAAPAVELAWLVEDGDGALGYALLDDRGDAPVAELSVRGDNASATRLYESVGMRPVWTIERWEKPLRPM